MLELDLVQHNFYLKFNTCCMAWYSACACHFPLCFCLLRSMSPLFNYCLIKHYFTARKRIFKAIPATVKYLWFRCFFNVWAGGFRKWFSGIHLTVIKIIYQKFSCPFCSAQPSHVLKNKVWDLVSWDLCILPWDKAF